jgi:hypothetical protein
VPAVSSQHQGSLQEGRGYGSHSPIPTHPPTQNGNETEISPHGNEATGTVWKRG